MTTIRPLAPENCPHCGAKDTLFLDSDAMKCRLCGHVLKTDPVPATAAPPLNEPLGLRAAGEAGRGSKRKFKSSYLLTYKGELDSWARAAYDTGQDYIGRENYPEAIKAFQRALESQKDFLDAHLWIALLSEDPVVKRDHLTTILAYDPNHIEALRELMVLDGRLTPEQASRTYHYDEPEVRRADLPVGATSTVLKCPVCEGDLTVNEALRQVECKFCGYKDKRMPQQAGGADSLTMALLERKAKKTVRWVIGERLLHCNNCGAERTIAASTMSTRCPFCGSNHVIEQDAVGSFEQPDGLVPFKVSRKQAGEAIKVKLAGWSERIKGWFVDNKIKHGTLEGVYLPFWVFDSVIDVTKTVYDARSSREQHRRSAAPIQPMARYNIPELFNDLPICAVESPPLHLTLKLGKYDLDTMVAYEPELLAKYPAELYMLDFDRASLQAREVIGRLMREKYGQKSGDEVQINVFSGVKQMSFQLALLPVWVATLTEADGDTRLALVNGQTGTVVLGKAKKSS
jgi:DNA-directed RNA polymerase subunit RPC12/RpoP